MIDSVKPKVFQRVISLEQKPLETTHRIETLTREDLHILMGLQKRRDQGAMKLENLLKKQRIADELWV